MEQNPDDALLTRFRDAATPGVEESRYMLSKFHKFETEDPYSIDKYYSSIPTFETTFIPISIEEGQAIIARYRQIYDLKGADPTFDHQKTLQNLQQRLNDQILKYGGGAFVRLSRRSPKDAISQCPSLLQRAKDSLRAELSKIESPTIHDETVAVFHAMSAALQVHSGAEAIEMITHSERAFVDLLLALDFAKQWTVQAAVRKWTEMPIEAEFRAFIYNGKLNAISQYCDLCYFPSIVQNKQKIQAQIVALFEQIKASNSLPFPTCVMDFACLPEKTFVIEINPYLASTGAGLFCWKQDKAVLENGPLEFRVLEKQPEHSADHYEGLLGNEWTLVVTEIKNELKQQRAIPDRAVAAPEDESPSTCTLQ